MGSSQRIHLIALICHQDDLFLLDRLVQRGSTIVPVLNMAEQLSDPKWSRLPKKLNELHIPVPYVIGPFLGVTKHDDPDGRDFAKLVAAKMWPTARDPKVENPQRDNLVDRVLPCALVEGFSAKYLLDALSSESAQGKPSLHTAWADKSDISFWVGILWDSCCVSVGFLLFVYSAFGTCLNSRTKRNTMPSR